MELLVVEGNFGCHPCQPIAQFWANCKIWSGCSVQAGKIKRRFSDHCKILKFKACVYTLQFCLYFVALPENYKSIYFAI